MNVSFGTKIIVQNLKDQRSELQKRFKNQDRKSFNVPMCDFWVDVEDVPKLELKSIKKNHVYKPAKNFPSGKYKMTKNNIYAETNGIDICSGGVIIGNNGKVAMFHIAPTLDNYDLLLGERSETKDYMGSSIDKFKKSADGIRNAVIVGGKQATKTRDSYSQIINNAIREKFISRDIPVTILSDFKAYECDLFYSSANDTLKIGVNSLYNKNELKDVFGEVIKQENDSIKINKII